jgi:hypothetical protein
MGCAQNWGEIIKASPIYVKDLNILWIILNPNPCIGSLVCYLTCHHQTSSFCIVQSNCLSPSFYFHTKHGAIAKMAQFFPITLKRFHVSPFPNEIQLITHHQTCKFIQTFYKHGHQNP